MFNSNIQPKRIVKAMDKEDWDCFKCEQSNRSYYTKCPSCGSRRDQGDSYRKGGKVNGRNGDEGC